MNFPKMTAARSLGLRNRREDKSGIHIIIPNHCLSQRLPSPPSHDTQILNQVTENRPPITPPSEENLASAENLPAQNQPKHGIKRLLDHFDFGWFFKLFQRLVQRK